jgi:hypothetical protein
MARGIAIRNITPTGDGRFEVSYASGSPTAPAGTDGSFIFQSEAAVHEEIKALEQSLTNYQLVLLHLAITWLQQSGSFGNINQVLNKELRFDTTAPNVLRVV